MPSPRVIAVIAAAGKGTRLGASVPKAFVPLRGRTLLERSVHAMEAAGVDEIIVVVAADMAQRTAQLLKTHEVQEQEIADAAKPTEIRIIHGAGERADSVWRGLLACGEEDAVVLVHDAARALTPPELIRRVVEAIRAGAPAVIPVLPVADTIKRVAPTPGTGAANTTPAYTVVETPDRGQLRAVQTPQGFDLATLRAANEAYFAAEAPGFTATDDASLMEWFGVEVACVPGDPLAFKVTTPLDFTLAQALVDGAAQNGEFTHPTQNGATR